MDVKRKVRKIKTFFSLILTVYKELIEVEIQYLQRTMLKCEVFTPHMLFLNTTTTTIKTQNK